MEMFCGNTTCPSHTVKTGGRFVLRAGMWICQACDRMRFAGEPGKNLYEFETMHMSNNPNGGPVRVQNLRHLRQLEKQHGVISVAANYNEKSW